MSKLMSVLGIILLAVGLVLGLLELMQPGRVQGLGISIGTAIDLIIGGILALGLGGVIDALRGRNDFAIEEVAATTAEPAPAPAPAPTAEDLLKQPGDTDAAEPAPAVEEAPSKMRFGFGRKTAAVAATTVAVTEVAEAAKTPVQETLDALEQAKQDIKGALGGVDAISAPAPAEVVEEAAAPAEDELYVVEEKTIRGRPARILSDDTVEAETDEGWMRFENLEHLNEYLDAAGQ
jgi:hypothetical protein